MLRTVIPRSVKVSEAPGYGQTVLDYDPGSRGAMSYLDAAREIAERRRGPYAERSVMSSGTAEPAIRRYRHVQTSECGE